MRKEKTQRIAVFGGTFDPPHIGHFRLAEKILQEGFADEVMFVPSLCPPHKPGIVRSSFEDRLNMVRLGLEHIGEKGFSLNDIEKRRRNVPSYTYDTMMELAAENPEAELILLLGGDSLMTIHSWYRSDDLIAKWKILTYPRSGFNSVGELNNFWADGIASKLAATILPLEICDVSSTEIREKIQHGDDVNSMLFPEVYQYIQKRGLYKRG